MSWRSKKRFISLVASLVGSLVGATAALATGLPVVSALPPEAESVEVEPPPNLEEARPDWRWIGIKSRSEDNCPGLQGWRVRHLFGSFESPVVDDEIPPGLLPFCVYELDEPTTADIERLLNLAGDQHPLSAVDRDIMALVPQGSTSTGLDWRQSWTLLRENFLSQSGQVADGSFADGGGVVRLAVIDSQPTDNLGLPANGGFSPGNSLHGFSLLRMAEDLLCRPGCVADLVSYLALYYTCFDSNTSAGCRDPLDGGFVGLFSDLASAIREAARDSQSTAAKRLILNLSVGWNPRFGGVESSPDDMPVVVEAVYRALEDAVCRGAIVVSAAGNHTNGPEPSSGPLFPGGWEDRAAPDAAACATALGEPPDANNFPTSGTEAYRPLVYAAGGIRSSGLTLSNSRPGSEPRVSAYADHAVTTGAAGEPSRTAILTGTSVSALVVSAAAAATAYFRPDLGPFEVMDTIHDAGEPLARQASWCLSSEATCEDEVRRISVCSAIEYACAVGPCLAGAPELECPAWPSEDPDVPTIDFSLFDQVPTVDAELLNQEFFDPACGFQVLSHQEGDPLTNPCPHHQFYDLLAEPWLNPQPCSQPCPPCHLSLTTNTEAAQSATGLAAKAANDSLFGTLYIEIVSDFEGTLEDLTLSCGKQSFRLPFSAGALRAGDRAKVVNVPASVCAADHRALLMFTVRDVTGEVRSVASPLLVLD